MFKTNYKATLKSIFRSPIFLITLGITIILTIAFSHGGSSGEYNLFLLRQEAGNHIRASCYNLFPPFVGILISAHILSEYQNGFGDLLVSSRKSILSIYLSKLCAVGTVTLWARFVHLSVWLLWFWCIKYPMAYASIGVSLPLEKILAWYVVNEAIYAPFLLLCFIAMPVFVTVNTNIPAAGAVWNVAFYLAGFIINRFARSEFFLPPRSLDEYIHTFMHIDNPQYMADLQAGLVPNPFGEIPPTLPEVLISYIGWIVFSVILLAVAYRTLKKRYRE